MLWEDRGDEMSFHHRIAPKSLIMIVRRSTFQLPFLALAVVTVLLSHDLIMTTGPHNLAAHAF